MGNRKHQRHVGLIKSLDDLWWKVEVVWYPESGKSIVGCVDCWKNPRFGGPRYIIDEPYHKLTPPFIQAGRPHFLLRERGVGSRLKECVGWREVSQFVHELKRERWIEQRRRQNSIGWIEQKLKECSERGQNECEGK